MVIGWFGERKDCNRELSLKDSVGELIWYNEVNCERGKEG